MCRIAAILLPLSLSACGGGSSDDTSFNSSGQLTGGGLTACTYDQFAGGGGKRMCVNTSKQNCATQTYGANQTFYTYSTCSDLGF